VPGETDTTRAIETGPDNVAETATEYTNGEAQRQSTQTERPRKAFSHVTELNTQILNSSDTKALWRGRGRDGPDRQTDRKSQGLVEGPGERKIQ
jgi:hypothetical protein